VGAAGIDVGSMPGFCVAGTDVGEEQAVIKKAILIKKDK
jgi:hypothetical protein